MNRTEMLTDFAVYAALTFLLPFYAVRWFGIESLWVCLPAATMLYGMYSYRHGMRAAHDSAKAVAAHYIAEFCRKNGLIQ